MGGKPEKSLEIPPQPSSDKINDWINSFANFEEIKEKDLRNLNKKQKELVLRQGTGLASYLWTECKWKNALKSRKFTFRGKRGWQGFASLCKLQYRPFLDWWEEEDPEQKQEKWKEAVKELRAKVLPQV